MSVTNYWQEINPLKASIPFRACYVLRNLLQWSFNNNNIHVFIIEKSLFVLAYTLRQNLLCYTIANIVITYANKSTDTSYFVRANYKLLQLCN